MADFANDVPGSERLAVESGYPGPIILMDNRVVVVMRAQAGTEVVVSYHLLEGRRRLRFLLALKRQNALVAAHKDWVATKM